MVDQTALAKKLLELSGAAEPVRRFAGWLLSQCACRRIDLWLVVGLRLGELPPVHLVVLSPDGLWAYEIVDWSGDFLVNRGLWTRRGPGGRPGEPVPYSPDVLLCEKARRLAVAGGLWLGPAEDWRLGTKVGGAVVFTGQAHLEQVEPLAPCLTFSQIRDGQFCIPDTGSFLPWHRPLWACLDGEAVAHTVLQKLLAAHEVNQDARGALEKSIEEMLALRR